MRGGWCGAVGRDPTAAPSSKGVSIRQLSRRMGLHRNTIRRALRSDDAPRYVRGAGRSKLIRSTTRSLGFCGRSRSAREPCPRADRRARLWGGKTLVYDYLSEVRPLYLPRPRTLQRTVYRPGEILQFDLWAPGCEIRSAVARRVAVGWWSVRLGSRAPRRDAGVLQGGTGHPGRFVALDRASRRAAGEVGV